VQPLATGAVSTLASTMGWTKVSFDGLGWGQGQCWTQVSNDTQVPRK
jgi:hypothetical protein